MLYLLYNWMIIHLIHFDRIIQTAVTKLQINIKMISIQFDLLICSSWFESDHFDWVGIVFCDCFKCWPTRTNVTWNVRKMLPFFVLNRILTGFRFAASFVSQRKWIVPTAIQQFVSQWCFVPAGLCPQQNRCRFKLIQVDTSWLHSLIQSIQSEFCLIVLVWLPPPPSQRSSGQYNQLNH